MDAAAVNVDGGDRSPTRAGYRRSTGSPRGEARRRELLDRVSDDLAVNGLVDFSLRRAARAAGTTHKVLLYHFDGAEDLLAQAIFHSTTATWARAVGSRARCSASGSSSPTGVPRSAAPRRCPESTRPGSRSGAF